MRYFLLTLAFLLSFEGIAQKQYASWTTSVKKVSETAYDLTFEAEIAPEWHVYSQFTPDGGSLPMVITFENAGLGYELVGKAQESATETKFSEIFEVDEVFFVGEAKITQRITLLDASLRQIKAELDYQVCKEVCIRKIEEFTFVLDGGAIIEETKSFTDKDKELTEALILNIKNRELLEDVNQVEAKKKGLWGFFLIGILGGLVALLMPCTFPMIPLTVSFFTKHAKSKAQGARDAIIYGLSIVAIAVLLSIPFHLFDSIDEGILNTISTNAWLNVILFAVFIFFAFSLFGFYELTLPNSWSTKMDKASNRGGLIGIFFMALTLVLVSFSCTGPILGGLLAGTATSEGDVAMNLTFGMLGFGVAFALPFTLFALFPNMLSSLPKSGGWMNTVKVVLGFVELAFAFKFLSNADLVEHWGLLKREIFIGIWILIFVLLVIYLFGKLKFPHDGPLKKMSTTRIGLSLITIAFVAYLAFGFTNRLSLLSGILPPEFYSVSPTENDCPLGLDCYKDFEEGLAVAKSENKPVLLDFTGWACQNCRRMEENVWVKNEVYDMLSNDYILISLYVDDRKELPVAEQFNFKYRSSGRIKEIETVGEKWGTFQSVNFKSASQPYYVLLSPDMEVLNTPQQYTDAAVYSTWLREGLQNFEKTKQTAANSD
ncbi:cytochrome c biogenesis protein CcdA [Sungkyunkwania multivorans]|uniref:Cytochrome c biogenesis protein CcdA n=1 Tax=Sungkyunkwania multivorans TaxID=1173618 RepID=A0ABW3CUY8_9FLAO